MPRFHLTNFILFLIPAVLLLMLTGCLGLRYNIGSKSLFGQDVQTVYVPVFQSDVIRRDLAERLTEAVCKRIEARSSYKVVDRPTADSVLEGRIVRRSQGTSVSNNFSDPRQKTMTLSVEVRWTDRRDRALRQFEEIAWREGAGTIDATTYMVAEYGQSELTAEQKQIDSIADQIVGMMEVPW